MSAVLDQAQSLLKGRLTELDDERNRLERALAELNGGGRAKRGRPRKGTGRPARKSRKSSGGNRAEEALALISASPGITASEIAKTMNPPIKPNYLYRVLGDLAKEKKVKKDGRKYFLA